MIAQILQIVTLADTLLGTETAKRLLGFLTKDAGLTPEQKANLDANFEDYVTRIARLRAEMGE